MTAKRKDRPGLPTGRPTLESRIILALTKAKEPMSHPEIHAELAPHLPPGDPFILGLTLAKLVNAGKIHTKAPASVQEKKYPAYWGRPIKGRMVLKDRFL
jgi:hypothetical protein